jgi:hypothetical protein
VEGLEGLEGLERGWRAGGLGTHNGWHRVGGPSRHQVGYHSWEGTIQGWEPVEV